MLSHSSALVSTLYTARTMSSTETWQELLNLLLYPRRSTWTPKRALPCNESGHSDRPLVSAIVQSFGDGRNARQLATRLERLAFRCWTRSALGWSTSRSCWRRGAGGRAGGEETHR